MTTSNLPLVYLCGERTSLHAYDTKFGSSPKVEFVPVDVSKFEVIEDLLDIRDGDGKTLVSVVALAVTPDGRVFYHYHANRDMAFSFDLISHVGQDWQGNFARIIADNKLDIVTREIEEAPWIYDAIAGSEAARRGKEA